MIYEYHYNMDVEEHNNTSNESLDLETGISCNTDLKMTDIDELERLKKK